MSFQSFPFLLLFLPVVIAGYFLLGRWQLRQVAKIWLIAASLIFYSSGRIEDLPLLLASVGVNFLVALALRRSGNPARKKLLLYAGVAANVLFLFSFKYAAFFAGAYNHLAGASLNVPRLALPLGISFFTIQQIMVLVDCYEGLIKDQPFIDYAAFAVFFPYVSMGPLVRWKQVAPQFADRKKWTVNADNLATGMYLFVIGLFKKVVLADSFFRWSDAGFSYNHPLSLVGAWIAALAFTFELYFDFSGYTDMAIGAARMLNIELPQNFNAPFRATSIVGFWSRWHMTLTSFITSYLYTPIIRAMASAAFANAMAATLIAMTIAGLWHGANWTFVIFGALHGIALVVNQCWKKLRWPMPSSLGWVLTFTFVVISFVFFRSTDTNHALAMLSSMFTLKGGLFDYVAWSGIDRLDQLMGIGWMLFGVAILLRAPSSIDLQRAFKPSWRTAAVTTALAVIAFLYVNGVVSRSFVYRDF